MRSVSLSGLRCRLRGSRCAQKTEDVHSTPFLATSADGVLRFPPRRQMLRQLREAISPTSLGPWGYVIIQGQSATLVDAPYYSEDLAEEVRRLAPLGVTHLVYTQEDLVAARGHASWKAAFPGSITVAHCAERPKASVDMRLSGFGPWDVNGFLRACYVPGGCDSKGSVFYASPEHSAVFTGESFGLWFGARSRSGRSAEAETARTCLRTALFDPFCGCFLPRRGLPAYFRDAQELAAFFGASTGLST
mmetsp:Transcript_46219/g.124106  ORF Transcript_46219/g.124106 Transcript_46219/m.124106 type:complete len:248 (-) Transcript_46219:95-838(-)